MRTYRFLAAALLMLAAGVYLEAKIKLPAVLDDNMVLQRRTDVKFWGWADPGSLVRVTPSWDGSSVTASAGEDGKWLCTMPSPEAGGPYEITFEQIAKGKAGRKGNAEDVLTLRNILVGEVWLCSGQSNMEMPVKGFDRQPNEGGNMQIVKAKPSVPIRMFVADTDHGTWIRQWSVKPEEDVKGKWYENTPEGVAFTSAVAYNFATMLQEALEIPVGVIVTTLGGSEIECWMSRESIEPFRNKRINAQLDKVDNAPESLTDRDSHSVPTLMFNAKIAPFTNFAIAGFLWYQGESNLRNAREYPELYKAMVGDWRSRWGLGDIPFYCVQIAPYSYDRKPDALRSAYMREAQEKGARAIPNGGIVTTIDVGVPNFIHPVDKVTVGNRLALLALGKHYGYAGYYLCESPYLESIEKVPGKIYINVAAAPRGLYPMWTSLQGFEIAGEDRVFHKAFAEIEESTCRLAVSSPEVPDPVAVRYGFHNWAEAYVFNTGGLPLMPFRTDDWDE